MIKAVHSKKYPKRFSRAKRKILRARDIRICKIITQVLNTPYLTVDYDEAFKNYIIYGQGVVKIPMDYSI